jgi:transcriptional regulator
MKEHKMSTTKATEVTKLLKKGMTPKEIMNRMAVSAGYISTLRKQLEQKVGEAGDKLVAMQDLVHAKMQGQSKTTTLLVDNKVFNSTNEVDNILDERAVNYGSFKDVSEIVQKLKMVAHLAEGRDAVFGPDQAEALDMIFTKIGRILNGDPNHVDSWLDIAGYAMLVADRLNGKVR